MNTETKTTNGQSTTISPATQLGHVHLTVADLENQIAFYQEVLGMHLHWREGDSAGLGAGEADLLRLTEVQGARRPQNTTGLYHFALLYPSRKELARAVARLFRLRYPNAPTDHVISETTYLDDPEGQTIELYIRTLDRGEWGMENGDFVFRRFDGKLSTGRDPLDVDDLMRELTPDDRLDTPLPQGTKIGHVHLYASSLPNQMRFYHDLLGFEAGPVSNVWRMGEVGLSQDQPHVVAWNTWHGEGAPPPPADSLGMRYFTIVLPDQEQLARVLSRIEQQGVAVEESVEGILLRDPAQQGVVLTTAD